MRVKGVPVVPLPLGSNGTGKDVDRNNTCCWDVVLLGKGVVFSCVPPGGETEDGGCDCFDCDCGITLLLVAATTIRSSQRRRVHVPMMDGRLLIRSSSPPIFFECR